jgi:hypothetical protein
MKRKILIMDYPLIAGRVPREIDKELMEKLKKVTAEHAKNFELITPTNCDEYLEYCRNDLEKSAVFCDCLHDLRGSERRGSERDVPSCECDQEPICRTENVADVCVPATEAVQLLERSELACRFTKERIGSPSVELCEDPVPRFDLRSLQELYNRKSLL